jgi:hypothetical protein
MGAERQRALDYARKTSQAGPCGGDIRSQACRDSSFDQGSKRVTAGDPGWISAHADLLALHVEKSSTYGTDDDRFANFTKLGEAAGQSPERYAVERLIEKAIRALHMIDAGRSGEVQEYPDIASLALCAEALRARSALMVWTENVEMPRYGGKCCK